MTIVPGPCTTDLADRRVGCLIMQAIGDALGFLVEGHAPELCQTFAGFWFAGDELPGFMGRVFGQYSDDT